MNWSDDRKDAEIQAEIQTPAGFLFRRFTKIITENIIDFEPKSVVQFKVSSSNVQLKT